MLSLVVSTTTENENRKRKRLPQQAEGSTEDHMGYCFLLCLNSSHFVFGFMIQRSVSYYQVDLVAGVSR